MFGYDQQLQFAAAVAKSYTDAADKAMQASTAFWSPSKSPEPGRSWYRPPATPNPFDWSTWAMPSVTAQSPWQAWGTMFSPMAMTGANSAMPWSAIAAFASTMAAMQPAQTYWASFGSAARPVGKMPVFPWQPMGWPLEHIGAMAAAMTAPVDFANYRSNGGHATAQITLANPRSRLH